VLGNPQKKKPQVGAVIGRQIAAGGRTGILTKVGKIGSIKTQKARTTNQ